MRQVLESFTLPAWVWNGLTKGIVASLIVVVGLGYLFQINNLSTSGYIVNTLEKEVAAVNDETEKLASQVAEEQSLTSVQKRLQGIAMVKATDIRYIESTEKTAFAR